MRRFFFGKGTVLNLFLHWHFLPVQKSFLKNDCWSTEYWRPGSAPLKSLKSDIRLTFALLLLVTSPSRFSPVDPVQCQDDKTKGHAFSVDGKRLFINGMNWDYFPIGTNTITVCGNNPMMIRGSSLITKCRCWKTWVRNAIRAIHRRAAKWIRYIYENYGIYTTMINHSFGHHDLLLKGQWVHSSPLVRETLLKEAKDMVNQYKGTPGFADVPRQKITTAFSGGERNREHTDAGPPVNQKMPITYINCSMMRLKEMKTVDAEHTMAICNGDLLF